MDELDEFAPLEKMAIASIPEGQRLGIYEDPKDPRDNGALHDYSHVLSPEQRKAGYSLKVVHRPGATIKPEFRADLYHKKDPSKPLGAVIGLRSGKTGMEPHVRTALPHNHRGKGLGIAMYEALYAHAKHNGIKNIEGGIHSDDAAHVHEALSRRHGMNYKKVLDTGLMSDDPDEAWERDYPNAPYKYMLKDELKLDKKKDIARVALIACFNESGKLLIGLRKDNGKYTLPGGHLDEGEEPEKGALRELLEETGLKPTSMTKLEARDIPGVRIHLFKVTVPDDSEPHSDFDPDDECSEWSWIDIKDGIPKDIAEEVHGPEDPGHNVLLDNFGFKKSEKPWQDSWKAMALAKMQTPPVFPKLGLENRAETPIISTPQQLKIKQNQMGKVIRDNMTPHLLDKNPTVDPEHIHNYVQSRVEREKRSIQYGTNGSVATEPRFNASFAKDVALRSPESESYHPNAGLATKHHEDFHQLMRRVEGKYGTEARHILAHNLWYSVPSSVRNSAEYFTRTRNQHIPEDDDIRPEEDIAVLHNYLNNPKERAAFHRYKGDSDNMVNDVGNDIKATHKHIRKMARVADESWLKEWKFQKPHVPKWNDNGDVYEKSFREPCNLMKAEMDEIEKMLVHPNPAERSMALKMHGVTGKHIVRALKDKDLSSQALAHPALDNHMLGAYFKTPDAQGQMKAMAHALVDSGHLSQLLDTHEGGPDHAKVADAIVKHPKVDAELLDRIIHSNVDDSTRAHALKHPLVHGNTLAKVVEAYFDTPNSAGLSKLAHAAMSHGSLPDDVRTKAWLEGGPSARMAIANGPAIPEAHAFDTMVNGHLPINGKDAPLRLALINHPGATQRMLETGANDADPGVKNAALTKLMKQKVQKSEYEQQIGQWLGKMAVRPEDLKSVAKVSDPAGARLVDHVPDLAPASAAHVQGLESYQGHVLNSPNPVKKQVIKRGEADGITRKVIYKTPDGKKFMVKPYHEAPIQRTKNWNRIPHQGWAEMTNQALYHAAGIGHLHQKVHVQEHNMGTNHERDPALVVEMAPNMKFTTGVQQDMNLAPDALPETRSQARKIAIMDYLSNNLDRHGGNLLADPDRNLLAIDHSRSFQYLSNHAKKWAPKREIPRNMEDNIGNYMNNGPIKGLANTYKGGAVGSSYDKDMERLEEWGPEADWWGQVGPQIRQTMDKRLEQIRDPEVRAHVKRNFEARAKVRWFQ